MIICRELCKSYGARRAVAGLDLHIQAGEIFGLLGPNGAGKTTTINMLTTLSRADRGTATIGGYDVVRDRTGVRALLGVVPQECTLDRELTVVQNLDIGARLHGLADRRRRVAELVAEFSLTVERDQRVSTLSGGTRRRLQIARALLSRPRVLILDEPSLGLDPQVLRSIGDCLLLLRRQGTTILLTTHYLDEAGALCDRIGLMADGRLLLTEPPETLRRLAGSYVVEESGVAGVARTVCPDAAAASSLLARNPLALMRPATLDDAFIALTGQGAAA